MSRSSICIHNTKPFYMQEVRKVVGDLPKGSNKKVVFLITHSPFMLDFRSLDDLNSVISFSLDYSIPKQVCNLQLGIHAPLQFIRRLNAHHKQLFFSDSPVFVEGILDSQLVEALMAAQFTSVAGAGSCIIDAGGAEEVNHYFKLCQGLGKTAYFLYDLDSIFSGNLRECIKDDESIQSFLASAGLGSDFAKYCGLLEKDLTGLIAQLLAIELSENLYPLGIFLKGLGEKNPVEARPVEKGPDSGYDSHQSPQSGHSVCSSSTSLRGCRGSTEPDSNCLKGEEHPCAPRRDH